MTLDSLLAVTTNILAFCRLATASPIEILNIFPGHVKVNMREQLQARLLVLKREFEAGQTQLQEIERRRTYLHDTLLRMSGAIQVVEELLATSTPKDTELNLGIASNTD